MLEIPSKTYFKIGEAAKLVGVKPYIIRYWESEFRQLRLSKTKSGQRLFTREDIELLYLIRTLLYDRKYTVAGAVARIAEIREANVSYREFLESLESGDVPMPGDDQPLPSDEQLREELDALREALKQAKEELATERAKRTALEKELKDERLVAARALQERRNLGELVRSLRDALRAVFSSLDRAALPSEEAAPTRSSDV